MAWEVEQKYRVGSLKPTIAALGAWDVAIGDAVRQIDCYYRHPQRDFAQTDEALRLRSVGERNFLTYKGPKIDATTKTRIEYEVPLAPGTDARHTGAALLESLGFTPVATVSKHRHVCRLTRDRWEIELALDRVDQVGTFVELEVGVSRQDDLESARQVLADVASELGLSDVERRSYLELLLDEA